MKKEYKALFFSTIFGVLLFIVGFGSASASTPEDITLQVVIGDATAQETFDITLPYSCEIDGTTFDDYKAICALEVLKTNGDISEYITTYWPDYNSYTLDSLNEITNSADWSTYWSIWHNQTSSPVGIDGLSLAEDDELALYYGAWITEYPFPEPIPEDVNVEVIIGDDTNYEIFNILVPYSCEINDTIFEGYKSVCALEVLKTSADILEYTITYWPNYNSYTLDSLNNITPTPDFSSFWSIWKDEVASMVGIDALVLEEGSILGLYYGAWVTEYPFVESISEDITLQVIVGDTTTQEAFNITLPYSCEIDSTTFDDYKAICALEVLKTNGDISEYITTYWPDYSAYTLDSLNGIVAAADWSEYWSIWYNREFSSSIDSQTLEEASELTFYFGGYVTEYPIVEEEEEEQDNTSTSSGSSTSTTQDDEVTASFNIDKAIDYILSSQNNDGSFGEPFENDWAIISLAGTSGYSNEKASAKQYLITNPDVGNVTSSLARRALTLMSINVSPYNGTSMDYISKIESNLNKTDLSNQTLGTLTFSGIVLVKAGSNQTELINKITQTILDKQNTNGGFTEPVGDYTGPALEYFSLVNSTNEITTTITETINYLRNQQNLDGGFGDIYTTGWNMNGLAAHSINPASFEHSSTQNTPWDYLGDLQVSSGKLNDGNDGIWATTYVILGAQNKSWNSTISSFSKSINEIITPIVTPTIVPLTTPTVKEDTTQVLGAESPEKENKKNTHMPKTEEKEDKKKSIQVPTATHTKEAEEQSESTPNPVNYWYFGGGLLGSSILPFLIKKFFLI